jgi:hypothetical protein
MTVLMASRAPGRLARIGAALAAAGLIAGLAAPLAAAAPKASLGTQSHARITSLGTARVAAKASAPATIDQTQPEPGETGAELNKQIPNSISAARVPSSHVPRPSPLSLADATGSGFDGLNHFDQRSAGSGDYANTQFSLEPPDQMLCVGNGYVVEGVNTAFRVRSTKGGDLSVAVAFNQFFGLAPEIVRTDPLVFGEFTSDPKCYYDPGTGRFFMTLLEIDVDPATGGFLGHSSTLIAVSKTSDPTGDWYMMALDTTDNGNPGCPCFGDQPLIGADANGFYISNNEFSIAGPEFNGTQLYAISKAALVNGDASGAVHISGLTQAEGPAYSMQPTTTPPGGADALDNGGTEYFLSALDFNATLDNRITLWALTNTSSLASASPSVSLSQAVLASEVYGQPPAMQQRPGPAPLTDVLQGKLGVQLGLVAKPATEHLNVINANDDRMNQTIYADGKVWGAVNSVVKGPTGVVHSGIAWFIVTPSSRGGGLSGSIARQGYVSVANGNVAYPAIAANAAGQGVMSFSIIGPDVYPSVGYVTLSAAHAPTGIKVARWGDGPADGFTGEQSQDPVDNGVERWGDYGAAVAAADGSIWFANESINQSCTVSEFLTDTSCGGTRTILANWGTYIGHVTP